MSDNQNIDTTTNINETDTNKTSTDHSDDYEKICYVCRRPESKAGEMITMPGGMNFCHECMQKAFDSISKSGMDFSKLQNMPFMNMNLNDFAGMQMPNTEIPEKNKIKKKSKAKDAEKFLTMKDVPAPHQIKAQLDAYVIGQERAKRAVSVAVYNHYKRRRIRDRQRHIQKLRQRLDQVRFSASGRSQHQDVGFLNLRLAALHLHSLCRRVFRLFFRIFICDGAHGSWIYRR